MEKKKVKIYGRVQGVGFRHYAVQNAKKLNLKGWVQNMEDGTVESLIAGKPDQIDEMLGKLESGPVAARVERIEQLDTNGESVPDSFSVKH